MENSQNCIFCHYATFFWCIYVMLCIHFVKMPHIFLYLKQFQSSYVYFPAKMPQILLFSVFSEMAQSYTQAEQAGHQIMGEMMNMYESLTHTRENMRKIH